jgi:UDP-N-acetylmuramyl pentapeptide phosphotransferase/UDP-N-acetylglucosamine-1-phosphate transferase
MPDAIGLTNSNHLLGVAVAAALMSAVLIVAIRPLLLRYALARPNARSSHRTPTPQGAGIAVITATLLVFTGAAMLGVVTDFRSLGGIVIATLIIAAVGAIDDIRPIPVLPRLLLQAFAVGIVLTAMPSESRVVPTLPFWFERSILLLAGLWFVNLVNFMDGLDWMTVAEVVPITAALAILGLIGQVSAPTTLMGAALGGAMIGFAPFNRPVARVFLGDVGSLPIGLLLGWCLLNLAAAGHLAAAILLPLYYLVDATLTLLRRLIKGEVIWAAHRTHFYQRATDNGFSVLGVVGEVFALNLLLACLALISTQTSSPSLAWLVLGIGCILVGGVLWHFSRRSSYDAS